MSVARIVRYKLDGTRCGLATGRHAEWNWAYRVYPPIPLRPFDMGRGLVSAREQAATTADTVVEDWPGGNTYVRGPRGGLKVRQ